MKRRWSWRVSLLALVAAVFAGCGGGSGGGPSSGPLPPLPPATKGKYFTHIVVVVQENRTFDNLFATFPGADGTRTGELHDGSHIPLQVHDLFDAVSPNTDHLAWSTGYNHGLMNGFDLIRDGPFSGTALYQYVNPAQIQPYWTLAKQYVLADHMFQTQGTGSFTAHQDLIAGGAAISKTKSLIDFPTLPPWGCDAPKGTLTTLITAKNVLLPNDGPFPCLTYPTLRDTLDDKAITWRYYAPQVGHSFGGDLWNAFSAIAAVRHGPEWSTNVTWPETNVFKDIANNTLPSVTWVIPDFENSDHPAADSDTGPSWVAQIVNAIGRSAAWDSTAIVIVWDDWGGWYDHVPPPQLDYDGLGIRVPMMCISPYSPQGVVSHTQYESASILRFVEDTFGLAQLSVADARAQDPGTDCVNLSQQPRAFSPISTSRKPADFLRRLPDDRPPDDQ
jgi:phospholipase C